MSLVSEALRKARQEGRIRESRRFLPSVPLDGSGGRRRGLSPAVVLALAFAAAAWGGTVAWLLLTRSGPAPGSQSAGAAAAQRTNAAAPTAVSAHSAPVSTPTSQVRPDPISPAVQSDSEQAPVIAAGAGHGVEPGADMIKRTAPQEPAASDVATPAGATRQTEQPKERVFVIDADLGYAKLHLDYLVYKPSAPFGSINGQYVAPGSVVAGFRVDEFGEDFIRLSDSRGPLILRVR